MNRADRRAIKGATMRMAQKCADAFTNDRVEPFGGALIDDSGILGPLYDAYVKNFVGPKDDLEDPNEFRANLLDEMKPHVGKMIAICYAMGYMDGAERRSVTELITQLKSVNLSAQEPKVQSEEKSSLILTDKE